jgi:hypothetical protein
LFGKFSYSYRLNNYYILHGFKSSLELIYNTTKKCGFLENQLDQSVHIDPSVCPFWLKVWGMKTQVTFD